MTGGVTFQGLLTAAGVEDIFIDGDRVTYFEDGRLRRLDEATSDAENHPTVGGRHQDQNQGEAL